MPGNRFWNFIKNAAQPEEAELFLWGPISTSVWWGDEVTPQQFRDDLKALGGVKKITVRINSPGGDVFAAESISGMLRDSKAEIIAQIEGYCASAATIIASNADKIRISAGSMYLIHDPMTNVSGNIKDLQEAIDFLLKGKEMLIETYTARTGLSHDEIFSMMEATTKLTGREAVEMRFADELIEVEPGPMAAIKAYSTSMAAMYASMQAPPTQPDETDKLRTELELLSL
jgi:ATP-dependent Clp protease, protease subunit